MKCRINDASIAKGARTITFDSVSLGGFEAVESGMTLLVGASDGGSEVGRIRIRSATSTQFVVSENSNIKWENLLHLTVLRYFEIWPIFPRIIQDPLNREDVLFYKDYDVVHTTQNFVLGTFVNAGPNRPVLIDNATGTSYYSSTGTYNLLENPLTYDWAFEGGNPTGSIFPNPGTVYYTTPGDYVTRLIITDVATGAQDTTYRHVAVRNKIGEGSNTPVVRWKMNELRGSRAEGGYSAEFTIYDTLHIEENAIVMLLADDHYGDSHVSLGGNYPNEEDIFLTGYVDTGSIRYDYQKSQVTFTVSSVTSILKKATGFSVSVESKSNPNTWFQLRDMDVRRAIYHYLRWHSTVLSVTDFAFVGQDYKIQYFDVDRTSIFDAVDELMRGTLAGTLASDRQGKLWAEVDPMAYPNPTGTFTSVMTITKRDWSNEPFIEDDINDTVSYIEQGGIAYSGSTTGTFSAFLAGAPGLAPSFAGTVERNSGLALESQSQLNQLVGNVWANRNQEYPRLVMDASNPYRNLDIAPQEVTDIHILPSDTVKNVAIDKLYIPSAMSWNYDSKNRQLRFNVEFSGLVSGNPGDTITIPVSPEDNFEVPDFNFSFPPFPPFTIPVLSIINPNTVNNMAILVKDYGIFYTNDFTSDSPTWASSNVGLPATDLVSFEVSTSGKMYCHIHNAVGSDAFGVWYGSIYVSPEAGGVWSKLFEGTDLMIGNPEGYPFPRGYAVSGFGINRWANDEILIIAGLIVTIGGTCIVYAWYGNSSGVSRTSPVYIAIPSASQRWSRVTLGQSGWIYTFHDSSNAVGSAILSPTGDTLSNGQLVGGGISDSFVSTRSVKTTDTAIVKNSPSASPRITTTDGVSYIPVSGTSVPYSEASQSDRFESIIATDDGQQIVVGRSAAMGLVFSNDFGASWITGSFTGTVTALWHLGEDSYVISGNNTVLLVDGLDAGNTVLFNKTGNLANIITGSFSVMAIRHWNNANES